MPPKPFFAPALWTEESAVEFSLSGSAFAAWWRITSRRTSWCSISRTSRPYPLPMGLWSGWPLWQTSLPMPVKDTVKADVIEVGDHFYIRAQSSLADDRTRVLLHND